LGCECQLFSPIELSFVSTERSGFNPHGSPPVGILIVQPESQVLKVFKHFISAFQEETPRVTRIVINDNKNIPLAAHGANPRGTDSVHMEELSRLLSHHSVNRRMGCGNYLAMMTGGTNQVTLKLEQGQSSK
jgi:hypothetical protein